MYKFVVLCLFVSLNLFAQENLISHKQSEQSFTKIKNFFSYLFPQEFVAEIQSPVIDTDVEKIPKIYIKNNNEKPVLMIYFSQKLGVKIKMTNVAKGISKQYNVISASFKFFYAFIQNKTYQDFQKKFSLNVVKTGHIQLYEKRNSKNFFYDMEIDKLGRVISVQEIKNNFSQGKAEFTYQANTGLYIIQSINVVQEHPFNQYFVKLTNYDITPKLRKEDFLG